MLDVGSFSDITAPNAYPFEERRGRGRGWEETVVGERPVPAFQPTEFVSYWSSVPSMNRGGLSTATVAELREAFPPKSLEQLGPEADDPVIRARDERVALLVRKYEGMSTTEDEARLQILTQRLRRLSPRVTPEDLNSLSTMVGHLEETSADLDEIRAKFGLR
jgi:hypothetical protein